MLKKLLVFAITSGLAAKAYKAYAQKKQAGNYPASAKGVSPARSEGTVRRTAA